MEYKTINKNNYKLHMIKTDKFKSILFKIVFRNIVEKKDITYKLMLHNILCYSNKKYNNRISMMKKLQDLYGADIYGGTYRNGKYLNMDICLNILDPKYTEESVLEESISLLHEVIFNPNIKSDRFDEESFNVIKEYVLANIESIKDNPQKYAIGRMLEEMGENDIYSYKMLGEKDILENINTKNLYEFYLKVLNNDNIDIFVIGNIDFEKMSNLFDKYISFNEERCDIGCDFLLYHDDLRKDVKEVIQQEGLNQSKLAIGCKLTDLSLYERNYVLPIYNFIFGGGTQSKLFMNVREKNSLAYYISSLTNKFDNLLIIKSGLSYKNYDLMKETINEELDNMKKGLFKDEDIKDAINYFLTSLEEVFDYPKSILEAYYSVVVTKADTLEEKCEKLKKVTKEDIIKVANKIKIDTIFLLKEELHHEKNKHK